jgi:alpha-beta hydrolase superfamily lysophospholipase
MKQILFILIAVLLIAGCETTQTSTSAPPTEMAVKFTTVDGWALQGTLYNGTGRNILLLHGLGDHRAAWTEFARILEQNGYTVLAIDLRGHGKSTLDNGVDKTWDRFTTADFAAMPKDAAAAQQFLGKENITIIGASIGANIALDYAAQSGRVSSLGLLSPGLDYKGITTEQAMLLYKGNVFIAAGDQDGYAADSSQRLYDLAPGGKRTLKIYTTGNHGTVLLKDTQVQDTILAWLAKNYPAPRPVDNSTNVTVSGRRF